MAGVMVGVCLTFKEPIKLFEFLAKVFLDHFFPLCKQCMRVPVVPYPLQHLVLSNVKILAILMGAVASESGFNFYYPGN